MKSSRSLNFKLKQRAVVRQIIVVCKSRDNSAVVRREAGPRQSGLWELRQDRLSPAERVLREIFCVMFFVRVCFSIFIFPLWKICFFGFEL